MAGKRKVYFLDVDEGGAVRGVNHLERELRGLDNQFDRTGTRGIAFGNIIAELAVSAGQMLARLPGLIFEQGTAVEETASKYRTVFGPSIDETNAFLDRNAELLGLTDQRAQEMLATTGAIAQGMDLTRDASAEYAVEAAKLAGDIASFNNAAGGTPAVLEAINSAVTGERERLKQYGIVIMEADVNQQALIETGKKSVSQLTRQEKAMATLTLITERAGVAVGDLERTQDSAANKGRRVAAIYADAGQEIAAEFIGVFETGQDILLDFAESEAFDNIVDGVKTAVRESGEALLIGKEFFVLIADNFQTIWSNMTNNMGRILLIGIEGMLEKSYQEIFNRERDWEKLGSFLMNKFVFGMMGELATIPNAVMNFFGLQIDAVDDFIADMQDRENIAGRQFMDLILGEAEKNWEEWAAIGKDKIDEVVSILGAGVDTSKFDEFLKQLGADTEIEGPAAEIQSELEVETIASVSVGEDPRIIAERQLQEMLSKTGLAYQDFNDLAMKGAEDQNKGLQLTQEEWKQVAAQIGNATGQAILHADSVEEAMGRAFEAIAQVIIALWVEDALLTAGASGPLAAAVAPVLVAVAMRSARSLISEITKAEKGGIVHGASHSQGGVPAWLAGGGLIELEGGEAIINKRSASMFRDELSVINAAGGGSRLPGALDMNLIPRRDGRPLPLPETGSAGINQAGIEEAIIRGMANGRFNFPITDFKNAEHKFDDTQRSIGND